MGWSVQIDMTSMKLTHFCEKRPQSSMELLVVDVYRDISVDEMHQPSRMIGIYSKVIIRIGPLVDEDVTYGDDP